MSAVAVVSPPAKIHPPCSLKTVANRPNLSPFYHPFLQQKKVTTVGQRSCFTWLLLSFLQLGYYSCFTPFKILVHPQTGGWVIHRNIFQQIVCALSGLGYILFFGVQNVWYRWTLMMEVVAKGYNGKVYFNMMHAVNYLVFACLMTLILWRRSEAILKAVIQLEKMDRFCSGREPGKISHRAKGRLWFASSAFFTFGLCVVAAAGPLFEQPQLTWLNATLASARPMLHLPEKQPPSHLTFTDFLLIIVHLAVLISSYARDMFGELFLLSGVLTLWLLCKELEGMTTATGAKDVSDEWAVIYKFYRKLKNVSAMLNRIYGVTLLNYVIGILLYFPVRLDLLIASGSVTVTMISLFVSFPLEILIFLLASDLCAKMQCLKKFLFKMPHRIAVLVTREMDDRHPVALAGCGGVLKLTYQLWGMMLMTAATYFVICVEKSDPNLDAPSGAF